MPKPYDPDTRWLGAVMHVAFFLLLGGALARFLLRHPGEPRTPWILALSLALAVLHLLGPVLSGPGARPTRRRLAWLGLVVVVWMVLVVLAPSFSWCAVPLFYTGLRTLPARAALVLVTVLTVFVVAAQFRLAGRFDPNLLLAPPAVAAIAAAVFLHTERQAARQRALIDDLIRTRRELAASERREGTLAERQRLSMEIHDSLAQGLSSQRMLLQAAERVWESDPGKARTHVRGAASVAEHNLTEARRFVHDLAPADLATAAAPSGGAACPGRTGVRRPPHRARPRGRRRPRSRRCPTASSRPCCASPRAPWPTSGNTRTRPPSRSPSPSSTTRPSWTSPTTGQGFDPAALPDAPRRGARTRAARHARPAASAGRHPDRRVRARRGHRPVRRRPPGSAPNRSGRPAGGPR